MKVPTLAQQIACVARHFTQARFTLSGLPVGFGDLEGGQLTVTVHQWQHLPRRAKTFGARWRQGRGVDGYGRPFGTVEAADGTECRVALDRSL